MLLSKLRRLPYPHPHFCHGNVEAADLPLSSPPRQMADQRDKEGEASTSAKTWDQKRGNRGGMGGRVSFTFRSYVERRPSRSREWSKIGCSV